MAEIEIDDKSTIIVDDRTGAKHHCGDNSHGNNRPCDKILSEDTILLREKLV